MKTYLPYFFAGILAIAVYLYQEGRIETLQSRLLSKASPPQAKSARLDLGMHSGPERRHRKINASDSLADQGNLPPKQELIKMGFQAGLDKMYGDFIESLQLGEDESQHFKMLLIDRLIQQRDLETRWLTAASAEKGQILREVKTRQPQSTAAISKFLNHPDDMAAFLKYEKELPERQNLADFPLNQEVKQKLIAALYELRIASGEDPAARLVNLGSIIETGNTDAIRKRMEIADQNLASLLPGILTPEETEAFLVGWTQVRENQLKEYAAAIQILSQEKN